MIRITPIRLIGADGEQVGVVETREALRMAEEAGMDLVEISPETRPPVCKIMDHGKYKYEQSKKKQPSNKGSELKEIRLGRSVKIDPHDVQIRIDQARRFLMAGHKVQVTQRFRGREMQHREIGLANLRRVFDALADIAKVEQPPRWMGRQAMLLLAPDKVKIEAIKRKQDKEQARLAAEASSDAPEPEAGSEVGSKADPAGTQSDVPPPERGGDSPSKADSEPPVPAVRVPAE